MIQEYMSINDAMHYLGFKSHKSIKRLIVAGLPVFEINGSKRISKTAIDEFMKAHTVVATTERKK